MNNETVLKVLALQSELNDLQDLVDILGSDKEICISTGGQLPDKYWMNTSDSLRREFLVLAKKKLEETQKALDNL